MELTKKNWEKKDINPFQDYLKSFSKGEEKSAWEKRIVNTSRPCLAVPSTEVDKIVKQIYKGNYLEFINLWIMEYHTNTLIVGKLIAKIQDFDVMKQYLLRYAQEVDNWSSTDSLKFKITDKNIFDFLSLAKTYLQSSQTFVRRLGVIILLKIIDEKTIDEILDMLLILKDEKEYYVNMGLAWLLAECFTKFRDKTLTFVKENPPAEFVFRKFVSKCHDSFRINNADKIMLKNMLRESFGAN